MKIMRCRYCGMQIKRWTANRPIISEYLDMYYFHCATPGAQVGSVWCIDKHATQYAQPSEAYDVRQILEKYGG